MKPSEIVEKTCQELKGVKPKSSWGETSLFYNPGNLLPNGVYFCTIKEKNGDNDKASNLDREGVFRVAIGLLPQTYKKLFGQKPRRPSKGGIISTEHDFTLLNKLMPHPIYAWMSWAQILSPTKEEFEKILPYIKESHSSAVVKFNKRTASLED
jgi:hypothetical protein